VRRRTVQGSTRARKLGGRAPPTGCTIAKLAPLRESAPALKHTACRGAARGGNDNRPDCSANGEAVAEYYARRSAGVFLWSELRGAGRGKPVCAAVKSDEARGAPLRPSRKYLRCGEGEGVEEMCCVHWPGCRRRSEQSTTMRLRWVSWSRRRRVRVGACVVRCRACACCNWQLQLQYECGNGNGVSDECRMCCILYACRILYASAPRTLLANSAAWRAAALSGRACLPFLSCFALK
jgi:hypothetical protein